MKNLSEKFTGAVVAAVPVKKRNAVLHMGLRVVLYSALLVGILLITYLDARQPVLTSRFSEQAYTEYAQEFSLLVAVVLFYLCVRLFPEKTIVAYLLGGFLGMAFIREYDAFLDNNVFDGAWQLLAYSLAGITAFLVYRQRTRFWQQLNSFIKTRAFGVIITGLLVVFIYSRLYSHKQIWMSAMGAENYMYVVTRASEEAIELLGYTLIMLGSIDYYFTLKKSQTRKRSKKNNNKKLSSPSTIHVTLPLGTAANLEHS